jgi:hypothetical protein
MREDRGVLRQLVVSKLDATWCGPWEYSDSQDDWVQTTDSLTKNLEMNGQTLEGDGEFLCVICSWSWLL